MKRFKDPNTWLIAVSMMLISVTALFFFTDPVTPPSVLMKDILGDWVAINSTELDSTDWQSFTIRENETLQAYCGEVRNFSYDADEKMLTVYAFGELRSISFLLTNAYGVPALADAGGMLFVRPEHFEAARASYLKHADIHGTWLPVVETSSTDSSYRSFGFTLNESLYCIYDSIEKQCPYYYNSDYRRVTVYAPEAPDGFVYELTSYYGYPVLKSGDSYFARPADLEAVQALYADDQPPEIIQRTKEELEPVLGLWKNWTGKTFSQYNDLYWQDFYLAEDMTCRFVQSGTEYPYNYDPVSKTVTVYCAQKQSSAIVYTLTEQSGITMLRCSDKITTTGTQQQVRQGDYYATPNHYDAAHKLYTQQTQAELYQKHQATKEILLQGKISAIDNLPYRQEDSLIIHDMSGAVHNSTWVSLTVCMTTASPDGFLIMDALQDVRLVTTSNCDNWSQADLEDHFGVFVSSIQCFDGSVVTPESGLDIRENPVFELDNYTYHFSLAQYGEDGAAMGPPWKIEDLGYQDLFVFFRIYGEDGVFYIQLDT